LTESFGKAFSAILRERCADYSENSAISSISLCIFVVGSGGGGDEKMAAAMAAVGF
jgi:hypothetical protein